MGSRMKRRETGGLRACLAALLVCSVGIGQGCDSSTARATPVEVYAVGAAVTATPARQAPERPWVYSTSAADAPARREISAGTKKKLKRKLDEILASKAVKGRSVSALLIDSESGRALYESNPDKLLKPASNTKLFTTAAAMSLLGEDYRFVTKIYADNTIDKKGVLKGNLYLVGQHDLTWSKHFYPSSRFPLDQMAEQLAALGLKKIKGKIIVQGAFLYDGFHFSEYSSAKHRKRAAEMFQKALKDKKIRGGKLERRGTIDAPKGVTELVSWSSVPLSVMCSPINRLSHNEFADVLGLHLGYVKKGKSDGKSGGQAVIDWVKSIGISTKGLKLNDGSGLSHDNRVSARQLAGLVQYMQSSRAGAAWSLSLSRAGINGTFRNRLKGANTRGRVFAKSGTLNGVITAGGFLEHKHDGRRYVFAILLNNVPKWNPARYIINLAVEAFAGDLLGESAARPPAPILHCAQNAGDGRVAKLRWSPAVGATGYFVWTSPDGRVWDRSKATFTTKQMHSLNAGPGTVYVRLTAVNDRGESDPSDVYGVRISTAASKTLLIDGNDRWQRQPLKEPTLHGAHGFMTLYSEALGDAPHDTCANEDIEVGLVLLKDYDVVIWATGKDAVDDESLSKAEQMAIKTYLEGGGALFLSGAEIGFDLDSSGDEEDKLFYKEVLHAAHAHDDADSFRVRGPGLPKGIDHLGFYTPNGLVAAYPDQLTPLPESKTWLEYVGGRGGVAALSYGGEYRLIYMGFPFESIDAVPERAAVMRAALDFLKIR